MKKKVIIFSKIVMAMYIMLHLFPFVMEIFIPHANVVITSVSFQEVPEEYEYCHKSLERNYNVRGREDDAENYEVRKKIQYFNVFWVSHHILENIDEKTQVMTYRKWSFLIPFEKFEYRCDPLGWP
jgi:hypothetical protein